MSFYGTVSGKFVNERRFDIITNNMANALTAGYKASRPAFSMMTSDNAMGTGNNELRNTYVGVYDTFTDFSDAPIIESGSTFDCAIDGHGFFVVEGENGNMYTRNGQFTLDSNNRLVTMSGDPVLGNGGPITIDISSAQDKTISIERDGSIFVGKDLIDTLKIVDFDDKQYLRPAGRSLFMNVNGANQEKTAESFSVKQGSYEASNVNIFKEMIDMIHTLRAYECYTKVDQFFSDMYSKLVDLGKF
ncbi:MAG: Flagellar basal-body rod protein FlgG [Syntrophorhabdus sp. PtaU1.Bin058]|nr:MAG: Flagellar basal-body rod protein FlgG [Syntrophorhabdus sp. PtaU1.Bin058]